MTAQQAIYIDRICDSGDHLLSLIENVLEASRIDADKMFYSPEPVPVERLISLALSMLQTQLQERQITVLTTIDPDLVEVEVAITDHGVGVSVSDQEKILDDFYQSDSARNLQLGGAGIGLALTKRLVALHGGEISVRSTLGVGSTFTFSIPMVQVPSNEAG